MHNGPDRSRAARAASVAALAYPLPPPLPTLAPSLVASVALAPPLAPAAPVVYFVGSAPAPETSIASVAASGCSGG